MIAPSKRVSIILLAAVLLVTGTIVLSKYNNKESKENITASDLDLTLKVGVEENSTDSDNDGLLDWEEVLWGTNPQNSDSDKDKTSDGDEVKLNRNPLLAGPNDTNYDFEEKIIERLSEKEISETSLTNKASIDLITKYFTLRKDGEISTESKNKLISETIEEIYNSLNINNIYSINLIESFPTKNNEDEILDYANSVFLIQKDLLEETELNDMGNLSEKMFEASKELISLSVPTQLIGDHLKLSNDYYKGSVLLKNVLDEVNDPILATISFSLFFENQQEISDINEKFGTFFEESGIIYDDNEFKIKSNL